MELPEFIKSTNNVLYVWGGSIDALYKLVDIYSNIWKPLGDLALQSQRQYSAFNVLNEINSKIYLGSDNGFHKLVNDKIVQISRLKENVNFITNINNTIFLGTNQGLFKLENDKLVSVDFSVKNLRTLKKLKIKDKHN